MTVLIDRRKAVFFLFIRRVNLRTFLAFLFLLTACAHPSPKGRTTELEVRFIPFYQDRVYLERIRFAGDTTELVDSAEMTYGSRGLHFRIPDEEESVYQLRLKNEDRRAYFISDAPKLLLQMDRPDWKAYSFQNGGYNTVLRNFMQQQTKLQDSLAALNDSLRTAPAPHWLAKASDLRPRIAKADRDFADTVKSAAAFLFVNNRLDFGRNFSEQKAFINRAAARFPEHREVKKLQVETLAYLAIFEQEYEVGQQLPNLTLRDWKKETFDLAALRGRFVLVDAWSSWCPPCIAFQQAKKTAAERFADAKLAMVGLAIDADTAECHAMIQHYNWPGRYAFDPLMWRGPVVRTFKFDSLPFNYLLAPDGRILAKAIGADSLSAVLQKYCR